MDLTNSLHLFALAFGSGLLGLVTHPIVKWTRKEIEGTPLDYLMRDHWRATVGSFVALITAVVGGMAANIFDNMSVLQIVVMAFPYGYANDSVINKGTPKVQDAPPAA